MIPIKTMVLKLEQASESSGGLVPTPTAYPTLGVSDPVGLGPENVHFSQVPR